LKTDNAATEKNYQFVTNKSSGRTSCTRTWIGALIGYWFIF